MKKIRYLICAVLVIVTATLLASAASAATMEERWAEHGQPETGFVLTQETVVKKYTDPYGEHESSYTRYGLSTADGKEILPAIYTEVKYEGKYIVGSLAAWKDEEALLTVADVNGNTILTVTRPGNQFIVELNLSYASVIDGYLYSESFMGNHIDSILYNSKFDPLIRATSIYNIGEGFFYATSHSSWGYVAMRYQHHYISDAELYKVSNGAAHKIAAYDTMEYFKNGKFAVANKDTKFGLINGDGELLLPLQYDTIEAVDGNVAVIGRYVDDSEESNVAWNTDFANSNMRVGMVDFEGHEILPPVYYTISKIQDDGTVDVTVWNGKYELGQSWFSEVTIKTLVTKTIDLKENKYYNLANNIKCVEPFQDVAEDAYYADAVRWANVNGVTQGTTQTTFSPSADVTRGQAVTFLWRAMGSPEPRTTECPFTDLSEGDFFYKPVLWAYENGITTGTSTDKYSPHAPCTNAQIITFLWRTLGEPAASKLGRISRSYEDGEWYKSAVAWAEEKSLLLSAYSFNTDDECLRGDMVTYIYRAIK